MSLPDEIAARMPMAYVHFVQVLVDVLCVMAPFALYPRGGACTVFIAGLVCLFFGGLQELCKTLLDPFGNRRVSNAQFQSDVQIDVLIAESNSGLSFWPVRFEAMPNPSQRAQPMQRSTGAPAAQAAPTEVGSSSSSPEHGTKRSLPPGPASSP